MTAGELIKQFIKPEYQKQVRAYSCNRDVVERRMWPLKKSDKIRPQDEVFIQVVK